VIKPGVAAAVLALLASATACGAAADEPSKSAARSGSSSASGSPSSVAGECTYTAVGEAARKVTIPKPEPTTDQPVEATISTSQGDIPVTLEADKAPCTVNSFLSLDAQGYFDDTTCHRLTTSGIFVLQCGDPSATGKGGPGYQFDDELIKDDPRIQPCHEMPSQNGAINVCTYPAGTVAMANAGTDAQGHGTNGSQFFLVYEDSELPAAYTVFGRMDATGLKTVRQIAANGLAPGSQGDGAPSTPVKVLSVDLD